MTTVSRDLGLSTHLKEGTFYSTAIPFSLVQREDHPLLGNLTLKLFI